MTKEGRGRSRRSGAVRSAGAAVRGRARVVAALLGVVSLLFAIAAQAAPAATPRVRSVEAIDALVGSGHGLALEAWANDGAGAEIPLGAAVEYHFKAAESGHLTVLHVDSQGVGTLLYPNGVGLDRALAAGRQLDFPGEDGGFDLEAELPVGAEIVVAVTTRTPITGEELGVELPTDGFLVIEANAVPDLLGRLRTAVLSRKPEDRGVARFDQRIVGRSEKVAYRSADIVDYLGTRTRSIRRPKLDIHVQFATGTADLDEQARENLDEVARALTHRDIAHMRFQLSGHTDDVGDEAYNLELSRRRAESVARYLEEGGVAPDRLELNAYGETMPLEPGTDAVARSMNRRVEFEMLR